MPGYLARLAGVAALAVLAACTPETGFRTEPGPIGATSRFEAQRFDGTWHVVSRFAKAGDPNAASPEQFTVSTQADSNWLVRHQRRLCDDGACKTMTQSDKATIIGPGRFVMTRGRKQIEHWVLWVDEGYRTAVVGVPSGAFGWIMERGHNATPPDRLKAARGILEWSGYDLANLTPVQD
ncbi:lipocalin family protein [Arenibacterium sp. CAU 1754]